MSRTLNACILLTPDSYYLDSVGNGVESNL